MHARLLRMFISELVKDFPKHENFLLKKQIIDSSRSVTRNMAEGYGRFTYKDRRNFFIMARGSITETMEHLATAFDEKYIKEFQLQEGQQKCELVFKLTNGYISYLEKSRNTTIFNDNEPNT